MENKDGEKPADKGVGAGDGGAVKSGQEKRRTRRYNNRGGNRGDRSNRRESGKEGGSGKFYGKSRYPNDGRRDNRSAFRKRPRYTVGERLHEVDLGITEYITPGDTIVGTIKERVTDFQVHEINLQGEIAKLTDQTVPEEVRENLDLEELKKRVPADVWEQLKGITSESSTLELDVTNLSKEQRKYAHAIVKELTSVVSETKEVNGKKILVFSKPYSNNRSDVRVDWTSKGGDYLHFVLHKHNLDTMDAIGQLARAAGIRQTNNFQYAGTKDRRARTTQWCSVKKAQPSRIFGASKRCLGVQVGNFRYEKEPMRLGELEGNRFSIALRNIQAENDVLDKAMTLLKEKGFINYYGLQRFGSVAAIPTHEIGKALLKGEWNEAIELILKPREGEADRYLSEARKIYQETKDAALAGADLRPEKIEAKLLRGMAICGSTNPQGALDHIPRNTMLMYIHAYQSLVWNKVASRRIKEFGLKPIVGDLVYADPVQLKDDYEASQFSPLQPEVKEEEEQVEAEIKEEVKQEIKEEVKDAKKTKSKRDKKSNEAEDDEKPLPEVKVLTAKDLKNYSISDVVIPQPGWKVVYPTYAKSWYDEYLEQDGLDTDLKRSNKKYTLSGAYRKIVQLPGDLTWKIVRYANKNGDLIASDVDELRGLKPCEDDPAGEYKALILEMSLKSSVYATMALREVLKCDTSTQTHAAQSAAFNKESETTESKNSDSEVQSDKDLGNLKKKNQENGQNDSGIEPGTPLSSVA